MKYAIKNKINRCVSNKDKFLMFFFAVFMVCYFANSTAIVQSYDFLVMLVKLIRYATYVFLAGIVVLNVLIDKKISVVMVATVLLSGIIMIFTHNFTVVFAAVILAAISKIDVKKIVKCIMGVTGICFFLTVVLSLVGVFPDFVYIRDDVERHSLGLTYPTDVFAVLLILVLMYIYIRGIKIKFFEIGIITVLNFAFFYLTNGRLSFVLVLFSSAMIFVYKLIDKIAGFNEKAGWLLSKKPIVIIFSAIPILLFVLSIGLVALYKNGSGLGTTLNGLLSDRLLYSSNAFVNYPLLPFGTEVEWQGWGGVGYLRPYAEVEYNFVDISYIRILFDYGVVGSIAILIGYCKTIRDYALKKDAITILVIVVMLLWCFVEPFIFNIGKNVFVIFLAQYMDCCKVEIKPVKWLGDKFEKILS